MSRPQLLAENATALLDDCSRVTAGQARRLGCEARIIPRFPAPLPRHQRVRRATWRDLLPVALDHGC